MTDLVSRLRAWVALCDDHFLWPDDKAVCITAEDEYRLRKDIKGAAENYDMIEAAKEAAREALRGA